MKFTFKPRDCQNSEWQGAIGVILKNEEYFCEVQNSASINEAMLHVEELLATLNDDSK